MTTSLNLLSLLNGENKEALNSLIESDNPLVASLAADIKAHSKKCMHIINSIDEIDNVKFGLALTDSEKQKTFDRIKSKFGNEKILNFTYVCEQEVFETMLERKFNHINDKGETVVIKDYNEEVHPNFPEKGKVYGVYDHELNEYFFSWDKDKKVAGLVTCVHSESSVANHIKGSWVI